VYVVFLILCYATRLILQEKAGDYDIPQASSLTLSENVTTRLDRLRRTLERHREESRRETEAARHARWANPPSLRRRRLRPSGGQSATYEERPEQFYFGNSDESEEQDEGRSRATKRRKTDHYNPFSEQYTYQYGHYGQVEPGRLKLGLYSCDGGVHDEMGAIHYGATNIIKHDQSVYCSRFPKCNIILQHHDRTPFCLEKLYIIAPNNGFTAPVKEGMVTVAMGAQELQAIVNDAIPPLRILPPPSPTMEALETQRLSLLESLHDPLISAAVREEMARDLTYFPERNSSAFNPSSHGLWGEEPSSGWAQPSGDRDWPALQPTAPSGVRNVFNVPRDRLRPGMSSGDAPAEAVLGDGMRVTMTNDDDVHWPEEPSTAAVIADRQRRTRNMRMEDEDINGWDPRYRSAYSRLRRGPRPEAQRSGTETPEQIADIGNKESGVTKVRFQIKQGKNKVAIKFDPPMYDKNDTHVTSVDTDRFPQIRLLYLAAAARSFCWSQC